MIDFSGKTVLVTGASGGIGSGIARLFDKLGADLILSGSNQEKLERFAGELSKNHIIKVCNLSDAKECNKLMEDIERLDILVCNAGITNDMLAIKMTDDMFDIVIDVNLKSSFILNREAIKKMIRTRWGRIINISSIVGVSGNPGQANYCASKAGLIGMTKSLASEVASRGVTINAIAPGFIRSNMTDKLNDSQKESLLGKIPMKAMGNPEDIANAVAFIASDLASYITGQTLHVNGGMLMV
jgi:3-oxoacyl-[acyl-carrier protein] reductase